VSKDYTVSQQYSQRGSKVIFYSYNGKEHIRITGYDGGDDVWYDGKVVDKKPKSVNGNEECYVYLFQDESGLWKTFVQLFEIYDITKSRTIPIRFLVHQTDLNGEFQTGRILEDISSNTGDHYAQEPGNNLRKTISQIKQDFPNLKYNRDDKGYNINSAAEDRDFTSFYFKNGVLVGEYTYIFDYSRSSYINDLYSSMINNFSKYGGKHYRTTNSGSDVTYFRYSYFTIKLANYGTQLQLYYELNDLNIEISPLVVSHLRK
jgi:hypothetical protein